LLVDLAEKRLVTALLFESLLHRSTFYPSRAKAIRLRAASSLLSLVLIVTALTLLVGQAGAALVGLVLAIPPVLILGVGLARKRR
jgi:hypothetical protein